MRELVSGREFPAMRERTGNLQENGLISQKLAGSSTAISKRYWGDSLFKLSGNFCGLAGMQQGSIFEEQGKLVSVSCTAVAAAEAAHRRARPH
jgi:hypothetical protein